MNPQNIVSKQKCIDYIEKMTIYGHFFLYESEMYII